MFLTQENYHTTEANKAYMSVSQYKDFVGMGGRPGCEAKAMAILNGNWETTQTLPMLIGSYIDAHFEGQLDLFKAKNYSVFKRKAKNKQAELKKAFVDAETIINRIERDSYFMQFMTGEKQKILTAQLFGMRWKCKLDVYRPEVFIADLKIMRSITETYYVQDLGRVSWVIYWDYILQGAIYQEIVRLYSGERLPFFIAAASKEKCPDIEIIGFTQENLDDALSLVETNVERIKNVREGIEVPTRCEHCDYCKWTKVLIKPKHYSEL